MEPGIPKALIKLKGDEEEKALRGSNYGKEAHICRYKRNKKLTDRK